MAFPSDPAELDGHPLFRLCMARFTVFDGTGATFNDSRWATAGKHLIYCGSSLALCVLENLVHLNTRKIAAQYHWAEAAINADHGIEIWSPARLEAAGIDWTEKSHYGNAQQIGDNWHAAGRDLFLVVPSVIAPTEFTVVINQEHPEFDSLALDRTLPTRYLFDDRLQQYLR